MKCVRARYGDARVGAWVMIERDSRGTLDVLECCSGSIHSTFHNKIPRTDRHIGPKIDVGRKNVLACTSGECFLKVFVQTVDARADPAATGNMPAMLLPQRPVALQIY